MEISRESASEIQKNETSVVVYSDPEKTKYGFIVYSIKRGQINTRILSATPYYLSERKAKKAGESLVEEVKKLNLDSQSSKLENMMVPDTQKYILRL